MALRIVHLCSFHFKDQDIRVVGTEVDGGTALNGTSDTIAIDGGGFWQADFTNANFGGRGDHKRSETLSWRALNAGLSGGNSAIVLFCDRYHQPVYGLKTVPHSDDTPFSDAGLYTSSGAESSVAAVINGQAAGLNTTVIDITIASERKLIGGERFTYIGANDWGERCAEILSVADNGNGTMRIQFQPPIRGGIAAGAALDFDNPRCVMRRTSQPTNALNMGLFSTASITFVEDMRDPNP